MRRVGNPKDVELRRRLDSTGSSSRTPGSDDWEGLGSWPSWLQLSLAGGSLSTARSRDTGLGLSGLIVWSYYSPGERRTRERKPRKDSGARCASLSKLVKPSLLQFPVS